MTNKNILHRKTRCWHWLCLKATYEVQRDRRPPDSPAYHLNDGRAEAMAAVLAVELGTPIAASNDELEAAIDALSPEADS